MTFKKVKTEMKKYKDFYGGDLLSASEIDKAKTRKELNAIIEEHRSFMECMLSDAMSHLDEFKRRIGISSLDR